MDLLKAFTKKIGGIPLSHRKSKINFRGENRIMELKFESNFIFPHLKSQSFSEAVNIIAKKLVANDYVVPEFASKVIEREQNFPTGLVLPQMNIGIPHTEAENVKRTVVSVATLDNEIEVHSMIDPKQTLKINMIFLIAVSDPSGQVKILQQLMRLLQNEKLLNEIKAESSSERILELLNTNIK